MTLQEVISAAKRLSPEERQRLLEELQVESIELSTDQRRDLDQALTAVDEGRTISGDEIRAMLVVQ